MIESKAVVLATYAVLLLFSLSLPFLCSWRSGVVLGARRPEPLALAFFLLLGVAVASFQATTLKLSSPLVLSLLFPLVFLAKGWRYAIGGLAVLPLVALTVWWDPNLELTGLHRIAFLSLGILFAALSLYSSKTAVPTAISFAIFFLIGVLANLFTGPLLSPVGFGTMWHHWGVYIAPAQLLLAGGVPFNDFPMQYGFGPMLLMAGGCFWDGCWSGGYAVIAGANLAFLMTMGASVLMLTRRMTTGVAICALAALACATLLWTSYPPNLLTVLATPSTGGIRFLPLSAMVSFIIAAEYRHVGKRWPGHLIWLLGVYWSPEAAFFVTSIWWPYLALRDVETQSIRRFWPLVSSVASWAAKAIGALIAATVLFALVFGLAFGEWPSLDGYLIYIRNPPGVMPVNLYGPLWILLTTIAMGFIAVIRSRSSEMRVAGICLLALIAVSSYYLGRSHDNNILNLFPFIVVLLAATFGSDAPSSFRGAANMLLIGIIAWTLTFGMAAWSIAKQSGNSAERGFSKIAPMLDVVSPASQTQLDGVTTAFSLSLPPATDASNAFQQLLQTGDGAPLWVNAMMLLPNSTSAPIWTGITDIANYALLPPDAVSHYIHQGAKRFNRPGWLVVDRSAPGPWLDLFMSSYSMTDKRSFGGYDAYRLTPK